MTFRLSIVDNHGIKCSQILMSAVTSGLVWSARAQNSHYRFLSDFPQHLLWVGSVWSCISHQMKGAECLK